jgi:hypothetical protein
MKERKLNKNSNSNEQEGDWSDDWNF